MAENNSSEDKINLKGYIIFAIIFLLLPIGIGVILLLTINSSRYFEILCLIFGCISGLLGLFKTRHRDTRNFKKNKTLVEDKKTVAYKEFVIGQCFFFGICVILIALSLVFFFALPQSF